MNRSLYDDGRDRGGNDRGHNVKSRGRWGHRLRRVDPVSWVLDLLFGPDSIINAGFCGGFERFFGIFTPFLGERS